MFKHKIKFIPKRSGERYASALTNKAYNNNIIRYYGKINLKDYITSFIKSKNKNYENCKFIKIFKKRDLNSKLVREEEESI